MNQRLFLCGLSCAVLAACPGPGAADAGPGLDSGEVADGGVDGGFDAGFDAGGDAGVDGGCFLATVGVPGECEPTGQCAAMGAYVSTPGYCAGPADIQCCTRAPSVADNPPVPAGWVQMAQSAVTPAMTSWAVSILHDPVTYPMFSTAMQLFGTLQVMARVEWHPPDFQNSAVHRGVTLYEPG